MWRLCLCTRGWGLDAMHASPGRCAWTCAASARVGLRRKQPITQPWCEATEGPAVLSAACVSGVQELLHARGVKEVQGRERGKLGARYRRVCMCTCMPHVWEHAPCICECKLHV